MNGNLLARGWKLALSILILVACLFSGSTFVESYSWSRSLFHEVMETVGSPETQWRVFLGCAAYFVIFAVFEVRRFNRKASGPAAPVPWLIGTVFIAALSYALNYSAASISTQALVLVAGAALGQGVKTWFGRREGGQEVFVIATFSILTSVAFIWWGSAGTGFQYRGQARWSGPWDNPNIYGLLMGVGIVLAMGLLLRALQFEAHKYRSDSSRSSGKPDAGKMAAKLWWCLKIGFLAVATAMMATGLVKSYSRGALIAVGCGLDFLGFQAVKGTFKEMSNMRRWIRLKMFVLALLIFAAGTLLFWQFRNTESVFFRRVFSMGNANDFSWRNRVAAWEGTLQMIAEKPWSGFGWNQSEPIYECYYRAGKVENGTVIQMNDYLLLGSTLGVPALACFIIYIWLSLAGRTRPEIEELVEEENLTGNLRSGTCESPRMTSGGIAHPITAPEWFNTVCLAGAIVLLAGFWFDGGLFMMTTAVPFWILLGLGSRSGNRVGMPPAKDFEKCAKWKSFGISFAILRRRGFYVFLALALTFATALAWAKARDPFARVYFSVNMAGGKKVNGIAIVPKPFGQQRPVLIYLHGLGGSLIDSGNQLRQLAQLGMVAVSFEYDQDNQSSFDAQFLALQNYLSRQRWAGRNPTAWIGSSFGAQRALAFVLKHPENQPQLLVGLSSGTVAELESHTMSKCPILLVHGGKDDVFSAGDCRQMAALLKAKGWPVDLRIFPDEPHSFGPDRLALLRGVAEYCASFFGSLHPLPTNVRPTYWHYWLPLLLLLLFIAYKDFRRWQALVKGQDDPFPLLSKALKTCVWALGIAALFQIGIHLGLPRLRISKGTLRETRAFLVRKPLLDDYDWLAGQRFWQNQRIRTLMQHLELADLQRKFFYSHLAPDIYRNFVLSPVVISDFSREMNWRRELWESFYPQIRHEDEVLSAARIVVRLLRERVTMVPGTQSSNGIESAWREGLTSDVGFENIYVVTLRSVGIAARLNTSEMAELWTGDHWVAAPLAANFSIRAGEHSLKAMIFVCKLKFER